MWDPRARRAAAFVTAILACFQASARGQTGTRGGAAPPASQPADPGQQLLNPGDEVDGNASDQRRPQPAPGGVPGVPGSATGSAGKVSGAETSPRWGVVLATVSDEGHEKVAAAARDRFAASYPELKDAYVRSTERGSVVMVGRFSGPQDPAAKPFLERVKALSSDGKTQPFARVYLSRVQSSSDAVGPHDLSRARRKFPNTHPLFTVQVAMWSDFDSDTMTAEQVRDKAEAHCRALRARGVEAYVKHDDDKRLSIVTVGVFDSSAYDARSTLFSPQAEKVFKQFPIMLVNGEELLQPPPKGSPPGTPLMKSPSTLIEIPP